MKYFKVLIILVIFTLPAKGEEVSIPNEHEFNFYSGMFDFSDDGKRSNLFGIQHQNENLVKDSFMGTLSPVTGFMMTGDSASYLYTGVQAQYKFGSINFVPSFTPGLYNEGDGKDLGHILEFKSEVQFSLDVSGNLSLIHISEPTRL